MFIGREQELEVLSKLLEKPHQHALIYGNRRVGKTTLALKAIEDSKLTCINYECKKDSLENNLRSFEATLRELNILEFDAHFSSFPDVFKFVNKLNKRLVFLIDEYPYLYYEEEKARVDSIFQNIFDQHSSNLNIIISGSHIGMMNEIMQHGNPLFGRFKALINLKELDYLEASCFYKNLTPYEKVQYYAVFGGSPFILEQLDYSASIEENIKKTFLSPNSVLNMFIADQYTSDLKTKEFANQIFEALGNSRLRYKTLEERLRMENNGLLSKQLKILINMNFIGTNSPINKINDNKKVTYFIKNNSLRFYYTYIYGKIGLINVLGREEYFNRYIKDSLTTFISLRFEDIAKAFISKLIKRGLISNVDNIGSYYYDDVVNKTNGEFDLLIQKKNTYDFIEVKYLKNKVNNQIVNEEKSQVEKVKELHVDKFGFISINGFEDNVNDLDYKFDGYNIYFSN